MPADLTIGSSIGYSLLDDLGNRLIGPPGQGVQVSVTGPNGYTAIASTNPATSVFQLIDVPIGEYTITYNTPRGTRSAPVEVLPDPVALVDALLTLTTQVTSLVALIEDLRNQVENMPTDSHSHAQDPAVPQILIRLDSLDLQVLGLQTQVGVVNGQVGDIFDRLVVLEGGTPPPPDEPNTFSPVFLATF